MKKHFPAKHFPKAQKLISPMKKALKIHHAIQKIPLKNLDKMGIKK